MYLALFVLNFLILLFCSTPYEPQRSEVSFRLMPAARDNPGVASPEANSVPTTRVAAAPTTRHWIAIRQVVDICPGGVLPKRD